MNLITNVSDSLSASGGEIWIRTGTRNFDADYLARHYVTSDIPAGDFVFLEVEDSGVGMDETTLLRIFDPFFTTKFAGRGLGLSVVFKTMLRHRGAVKVSSKPGRGTLFRLLFPPAPRAAALGSAALPKSRADSNSVRILVVDDESIVRDVVKAVLEGRGWNVSTASSGDDALRMQREHSGFDVVLLDLTMPGLSGSATMSTLRRQDPSMRVVLMSGFEAETASHGEPQRASGFLQEPFTGAKLVSALEAALTSE